MERDGTQWLEQEVKTMLVRFTFYICKTVNCFTNMLCVFVFVHDMDGCKTLLRFAATNVEKSPDGTAVNNGRQKGRTPVISFNSDNDFSPVRYPKPGVHTWNGRTSDRPTEEGLRLFVFTIFDKTWALQPFPSSKCSQRWRGEKAAGRAGETQRRGRFTSLAPESLCDVRISVTIPFRKCSKAASTHAYHGDEQDE